MIFSHDAENRLSEYKSLNSDGKLNSRATYAYEGSNRFPSKSIYFNSSNKISEEHTYSEYELNSRGDWIKRKESIKDDDNVRVALNHRNIEYYEK